MSRAELIADRGAEAVGDELFRSRPFLAAEGATHTLRVVGAAGTALVPLIVREVPGCDRLDAVSPYGYPGAALRGAGTPPAAAEVDWSPTGLLSIFARERVGGEPWLRDARERSPLLVHDPASARSIRPRLGEQVRANGRDGWSVEVIPGSESPSDEREAFARVYEQTMRRAGAAERYFFAPSYFDAVLSFPRSWLLVARRGGEIGAAAIAGVSDAVLHYYLGGTADSARSASPFKNVVVAMLDLADELGLVLNLGGGVAPGDGLEAFKRGFANGELPFRTHEVVCDPDTYARLAGEPDPGEYFPAYRRPGV